MRWSLEGSIEMLKLYTGERMQGNFDIQLLNDVLKEFISIPDYSLQNFCFSLY